LIFPKPAGQLARVAVKLVAASAHSKSLAPAVLTVKNLPEAQAQVPLVKTGLA